MKFIKKKISTKRFRALVGLVKNRVIIVLFKGVNEFLHIYRFCELLLEIRRGKPSYDAAEYLWVL
jgi:hypothetical protein